MLIFVRTLYHLTQTNTIFRRLRHPENHTKQLFRGVALDYAGINENWNRHLEIYSKQLLIWEALEYVDCASSQVRYLLCE